MTTHVTIKNDGTHNVEVVMVSKHDSTATVHQHNPLKPGDEVGLYVWDGVKIEIEESK